MDDKEEKSLEKYKEKKKITDIFNKKILIKGSTTLIIILIIFALYVGINILLEKVILPEIDLTENKIYSLSEETKTKVKNLKNDVKITLINYKENSEMKTIVEKYIALNSKVKVEVIENLSKRQDLMQKYSLESTDEAILVNSGEKEKLLTTYDLSTYDYTTYQTIDISEEAITNAIVEVTIEERPKIYILNNHVAYSAQFFGTFLTEVQNDANDIDIVDLLISGKVPDDCDCLIITTLKEDITEAEKKYILDYISNGGEILVLAGPNLLGANLTNFEEILSQYGIKLEDGVIFEGSQNNMLAGYPDFIIENVPSNSITKSLNMSISVCFADAAAITVDEEKLDELNVNIENLISTTSKAFIRKNLLAVSQTRVEGDSEEAEYIIGLLATKTIEENKSSKLIIYANDLFATDVPISINGTSIPISYLYNNIDVVVNSISYLNEREEVITIRKITDTVSYTVTEAQHRIIMTIIFAAPAVVIVIGIIVWINRRRKK